MSSSKNALRHVKALAELKIECGMLDGHFELLKAYCEDFMLVKDLC